jgi:hypothetical protein
MVEDLAHDCDHHDFGVYSGVRMQQPWQSILKNGVISGSIASVLSIVVAMARGRQEADSATAPVNAISHWVWKDEAFAHERPSLRHTLLGYVIHHGSAIFWAVIYEAWLARRAARDQVPDPAHIVGSGLAAAAGACLVDYKLTPERLTPGFEKKLSTPSMVAVYAAFGLGLTLRHLMQSRSSR